MGLTANVFEETGFRDLVHGSARSPSFVESQLLSRLGYATCGLTMPITNTIDALFGSCVLIIDLATAGSLDTVHNDCTRKGKSGAKNIFYTLVSDPFANFLLALNPSAKVKSYGWDKIPNGVWTQLFLDNCFKPLLKYQCDSDNFLIRNITSRLTIAVGLLAIAVTRIFDFAIGCSAAVLAFATLGTVKGINTVAREGLGSTQLIFDIYNHLYALIDPREYNF